MALKADADLSQAILVVLRKRFDAIVDAEIEAAKKMVEERMRIEAAKVSINLSKYFEIQRMGETITIRIDTRDLKL